MFRVFSLVLRAETRMIGTIWSIFQLVIEIVQTLQHVHSKVSPLISNVPVHSSYVIHFFIANGSDPNKENNEVFIQNWLHVNTTTIKSSSIILALLDHTITVLKEHFC